MTLHILYLRQKFNFYKEVGCFQRLFMMAKCRELCCCFWEPLCRKVPL